MSPRDNIFVSLSVIAKFYKRKIKLIRKHTGRIVKYAKIIGRMKKKNENIAHFG